MSEDRATYGTQAQPLITAPDDPRRDTAAARIGLTQSHLIALHRKFAPDTLAFKATRLAWEALRLAWYAASCETDGDHLADVTEALNEVKKHIHGKERSGK